MRIHLLPPNYGYVNHYSYYSTFFVFNKLIGKYCKLILTYVIIRYRFLKKLNIIRGDKNEKN